MRAAPSLVERRGKHFPVSIFAWEERLAYIGKEVGHLWLAGVVGEEGYGNSVLIWRGPMDVKLEHVRDHVERLDWGRGARIMGPDLVHIVGEFPQLGNDLRAMYLMQALLADELSLKLADLGYPVEIRGTDIYVEGEKLNVGVCAANPSSCTMHFAVNVTLKGEPSVPDGVKACGLASMLGNDPDSALGLVLEVVKGWIDRIDRIQLKAYKTA